MYPLYARFLIDSGATHSFVCSTFGTSLWNQLSPLDHVLCVSTPMGDVVEIVSFYLECELWVNVETLLVNLIPLAMIY